MAKMGGFPGGMGGMNMNSIMKQAKKMQAQIEKDQEELAKQEFTSTSGGGAVKVVVSGEKKIKDLKIDKSAVDPDDVEMLEDLIISCLNDVFRKVDEAQNSEMNKYNIPGLM